MNTQFHRRRPSPLRLLAFSLAVSLTAHAAAPKYDPARLRDLVRVPAGHLEMGFQVSAESGFTFAGEPLDLNKLRPPPEQIAELQKALTGGPGDAERYAELAGLYAEVKDEARSREARKRAIELFREQVKDASGQGWLRTRLGQELLAADQPAEGERLLRDAVALAPEDWRCWTALGGFTVGRAFDTLGVTNSAELMEKLQRNAGAPGSAAAFSADQRAKAGSLCHEAGRCYDEAVRVGPREVGAYQARVGFRWGAKPYLELAAKPELADELTARQRLRSDELLLDLKESAQLATNDPYAIGMAAFMTAMTSLAREKSIPDDFMERGMWLSLPDAARTYIGDAMSRLEELARHPDTNVAGGALAALGGMQVLVRRDYVSAEANLRRATRLRPASDAAWQMVGLLLVQSERWAEFAVLAEERTQRGDSVRLRLGLARIYERLKKPADIERHVQAALKLAPNDLLANTAAAAVRLKRATDDAALAEVGQFMARVKQSLFDAAPQDQQMAFEYVHGLYFGLVGSREEAASHFRWLRETNPDDSDYQEAYEALGL